MIDVPTFASDEEFKSSKGHIQFWTPHLAKILSQHGFDGREDAPAAGEGATFPTFLADGVVVKLFGHLPVWRESFEAERAAYQVLTSDPKIASPLLLAHGELFAGSEACWPYLVLSRVYGTSWGEAKLTYDRKRTLVRELGWQIARLHRLPTQGIATREDLDLFDVSEAISHTVLPPHLVEQAADYVARHLPSDQVFTNGDIMHRHVFVNGGRLSGIIDWGDASVMDRHYELAKLHLDLFDCDKNLLRDFLNASDWPVTHNFARLAMRQALVRQVIGLTQHLTMDVFYKVPGVIALESVATLDDLADELFRI